MITVFVRSEQIYTNPLKYILGVLAKSMEIPFEFKERTEASLVFDHEDQISLPVNTGLFKSLLIDGRYRHEYYLKDKECVIKLENGRTDWLGTAFYMLNAFQEYASTRTREQLDNHGRFKYESSYQNRFECIERNVVQECFIAFCRENAVLSPFADKKQRSRVFLSHDIDTIHGSFLQDGMWALKKGRLDVVFRLILNEILLKPDWRNMDRIVKLHDEYDLKSTFFWLATRKIGPNGVKNADYDIRKLRHLTQYTRANGLHKSADTTSLVEEMQMLPFSTALNRYHFLKFTLPDAWNKLQLADVKMDASLGFAERYGFRNSFGSPFRPYNPESGRAYDFVEVPLNVMDGTLHRYMGIPTHQTATQVIEFLEKNKWNCILSILWHNTYFTSYKYSGYLEEYKKILDYLVQSKVTSVLPEEIIREYGT